VSTTVPDLTGRPALDVAAFARDYAGAFGGDARDDLEEG
jgi:hypothetical protein